MLLLSSFELINSVVGCGPASPSGAAAGRPRRSRTQHHNKHTWITCLLFGAFGCIAFAHALAPSISPPPQKRGTRTIHIRVLKYTFSISSCLPLGPFCDFVCCVSVFGFAWLCVNVYIYIYTQWCICYLAGAEHKHCIDSEHGFAGFGKCNSMLILGRVAIVLYEVSFGVYFEIYIPLCSCLMEVWECFIYIRIVFVNRLKDILVEFVHVNQNILRHMNCFIHILNWPHSIYTKALLFMRNIIIKSNQCIWHRATQIAFDDWHKKFTFMAQSAPDYCADISICIKCPIKIALSAVLWLSKIFQKQ